MDEDQTCRCHAYCWCECACGAWEDTIDDICFSCGKGLDEDDYGIDDEE